MTMYKSYFGSFDYHTSEKEHLSISERILYNNRLYFTLKYAGVVLGTRSQALKGKYDTQAWIDSSYEIFRFIEKTGGKFHITGIENVISPEGPLLFIGNHMSTLETMVLPCIVGPYRKTTFVVKDSLVRHPLFKDVMLSRNPIVVSRTDPRKDFETVMTKGTELLSKGISIIIFPQSTRSLKFKPEEFNSLGVKLAKKAGVKVVPVALRTDFWGNGRLIKELGPIDAGRPVNFKFGEPFLVEGSGKSENQKIIDFIQSSLNDWA
jgi:1-acyl-sn-glycerol-3-phosphate acyltransferase